ncbi:MAG: pyridoxal-dependent decarboxylase [Deltaproteobacteria bacterium]|jgi:glutamate/tyrosine decarboxylase-like PLP-dependent enzyme|nr:pyridoxal-dependent decarboxylase [Deltaproteobacteria bacterium]
MEPEQTINNISDLIKAYLSSQKQNSFLQYKDPIELQKILKLDDHNDGAGWSQIFTWIERYLMYSVKTNHNGFVNRMWVGANLPSILGEIVAAVSNTSSCTYESAPVSTLMEKYMIQQMLDLVGFKNGEGQMATGSSNANMLAMMAARNESLPTVKTKGIFGQQDLMGFVSADAHYSMEKAANIIGLGTDHLSKIPVNGQGEMDLDLLEKNLERTVGKGILPFFVAGTAGTTIRGAYDSIIGLLRLKRKFNFWLHIDGAWGGAVLVSDSLRKKYVNGIEHVDSFTWDFHKMLGTSLMCNIFMINNRPHTLGKLCSSEDESYIFHDVPDSNKNINEVNDLGAVSLQCGRRVDSLKWFLDWKYFGKKEFGRRVERSLELCRYAELIVRKSDFLELVLKRNSFNICFRFKAPENVANKLNLAIRNTLYHDGKSLVGYAYFEGKLFLRLLLAGHDLTREDIDQYFSDLIKTGKSLAETY